MRWLEIRPLALSCLNGSLAAQQSCPQLSAGGRAAEQRGLPSLAAETPQLTVLALIAYQKFAPRADPASQPGHEGATSPGLVAVLPSAPQHPSPPWG